MNLHHGSPRYADERPDERDRPASPGRSAARNRTALLKYHARHRPAGVAMAVETFAPDMASFHNGRDFAAWLGLSPRQFSSGGKERLGRITKAGQADIREDANHWGHVAIELDGTQGDPGKLMAGAHGGPQAAHVGRHRTSQQDGAPDLGHADKNEDYENPMPVMAA